MWNPLVCLHIFQVCSVRSSLSGDSWHGWKSVHAGGVHGICVIPESFLRSLLMMTRPDMVGRCCSLMRIALRSSFVHLEDSLCQGKVRTHSCCARSISSPVHNRWMVAKHRCSRGSETLVPCSGDDEQWPQWVLKFEAGSELVDWVRQLDSASQSAHPIVNTTLEQEVQTI